MRKIYILFLLLPISMLLHAQDLVTGTVFDAGDRHPLVGATVIMVHSGKRVTADTRGRFALRAPLPDTLLVSFIGYNTYRLYLPAPLKAEL